MHRRLKCKVIFVRVLIQELATLIQELWGKCKPKAGKKGILKAQRNREINKIFRSIGAMMNNIASHIVASKNKAIAMSIAFEKEVMRSLHRTFTVKIKNKSEPKKYTFAGSRKNPRTTIMPGGKKETFPIRMIQCKCWKKKFSLVPSFLPREKNFGIEILGNVYRNMFRFNLSIQGALENLKIIGKKSGKSKQTILNWTRWIGKFHTAIILTRAGVTGTGTGTGYLQEDKAFKKG